MSRKFDNFGRNIAYTLDNSIKAVYTYDDATSRLISMSNDDLSFGFNYMKNSNLQSGITYPNGVIKTIDYEQKRDLIIDSICDKMQKFVLKCLTSEEDKRAWLNFTRRGSKYSFENRDIEIPSDKVMQMVNSSSEFSSKMSKLRSRCSSSKSDFSKGFNVSTSTDSNWSKSLGLVSLSISVSCIAGCSFSYTASIHDLYDFNIEGLSTSRTNKNEFQTILVRMAQLGIDCGWQAFYHRGSYTEISKLCTKKDK